MKALGANTKQNIQVMVRVRPLNHRELKANDKNCIEVPAEQEECLILDSKPESKVFSYDCVWGEKSSQENIFEKIGKPMADRSLEGYNCTVFAYGQTGSGKTFTMQGKGIDRFVKGDPSVGLQPRVLDYIFSRVREVDPQRTNITVKCSYIEIYNEQITDLLNPAAKNLQIREDARKGPFLKDVEEVIQTKEEAFELMMMGLKNRTVASTDMNDESSRSHTVFTLVIEQTSDESGLAKIKTGKINFVDLAGSERQKATNTAGERLKEAGGINRSLTILGGVINSLVTQTEGKSVHVRYRDSKLTFLLKDSLGGNTMTAIIANISPSSDNFGETLSTLKFAQRAKLIQNKAVVNEESSGTSDSLKNEISRLNMIIAEMSVRPPATAVPANNSENENKLALNEIKECLINQSAIEGLLKETADIININDQKLHQEYSKREEFWNVYQTGSKIYQEKENKLKLTIRLLNDKIRMMKGEDNMTVMDQMELKQTVQSLDEMMNTSSTTMDVFQENLNLKFQIVYGNSEGCATQNIVKVINMLRYNRSFVEEVSTKIERSMGLTRKLKDRIDKVALSNGMSIEDIKRINTEEENEELKACIISLNTQLLEKRQLEEDLKLALEIEKNYGVNLQSEFEKERMELREELGCLERRITELHERERDLSTLEGRLTSEMDIKLMQLKEEVEVLTIKKHEYLKKIDRLEAQIEREKKSTEGLIFEYQKRIQTTQFEKLRLEEDIKVKKSKNEKLEGEMSLLQKENEILKDKLKKAAEETAGAAKQLKDFEQLTFGLEDELKELKSRLHANESLQNQEIERLTFEVGQLMSDRAVWKDELDTLQQSNYHLQDDYERHQKEIIELNQSLIEVNQVGQGYQKQWEEACLNLKRVEGQLEEQAGSNSALDKAHKENSELRRVQKEWEAKVEVLNSHLGAERLIIESLKLELEEIKGIEETHSRLIKDLKERDKKATTEFNELRIHIGELMNEKQEWLQVERKLNEGMTQFQDENIFLKQKLHTDVPSYNHHFMKAIQKIDDLKQELKIKENDIKQAKNERDSWQHKYHDLKQYQEAEIMKMTKAHGKEKNELKASLEQLNHHSQLLSAQKLELEEKIKADLEAFKKEEKRKDQELKALMTHLRKREAEPSSEYYGTVSGIQDDFTDRSQDKAEIEKLKNTIDKLKADMAAKQNIFLTYRLNLDSKLKEQANQNQKIIQEFENYKKSYAGLEDCRKQLELDMKAVQSEKTRLLHENSWLAEENSEKEIQFENIKEHLGKVTERLEEQSYYISQLQALAKIENLESDKMACSHSREERVKALKSEANVLKEMLDQKSRGKDPQYWSEFVQDLLFRESLAELEADKAIQTNLNSVLKKFMAVGITENKRLRNGTHFLELLKKLNESLSDWEVARKKEKEREHTRLRLDCKAAELEKQMDSIQNMLIPNRGLTFYGQSNNQVPSYRHLEYTARNTVSRLRTGNDALTERTESRRVHTLSNLGVQVDSSPLQPSRSKTNQQTELGKRLSDAEGSAMKKKLFQGQESAAKDVQESENHLLASKLKKKSRHSNQADGDYNGRAEKEGSALKQLKMF